MVLHRIPTTLAEEMDTKADAINRAVKKRLPKSKLNVKAVPREQSRRSNLLGGRSSSLQSDWDGLDTDRRSAACRYEWARLQLFIATEVFPRLRTLDTDIFHVTLADKRWRIAPSPINGDPFTGPRRKVKESVAALRAKGLEPVFVATYEISGDRNLEGEYAFEPHSHILISGVTKQALKSAFRVRQARAARGRDKPVRIMLVPRNELGKGLGYLTKVMPHDRVEFVREDGRCDRYTNRMPAEQETQWLRCMAAQPITRLIQFGGFAESITWRFTHLKMSTIIGALV